MAQTGRIVTIQAFDLRVGDMFSGDSTIVDQIEHIPNTHKLWVSGVCHGIHKEIVFNYSDKCNLWKHFRKENNDRA